MNKIADLLASHAQRDGRRPAILSPGRPPLTYSELNQFLADFAARLAASGYSPQDRLAIVLPSGPEAATAFLAISAFAIAAPLNPVLREEDYAFYLSDLRVKALLVQDLQHAAAQAARRLGIQLLAIEPYSGLPAGVFEAQGLGAPETIPSSSSTGEDRALLLHTSGTTARPKIVPLTHRNLLASARNVAASLNLTEADRCLNIMPLFHIHGLVASLLASLYAGGSVISAPVFQAPLFFDWVREFAPTWYTAVPTMHQSILARAAQDGRGSTAAHFRFVRSCSAPLPPELCARLEDRFQAPVIEAYGMTEAAHQISSNPLPPRPRKPGTVGLPTGPDVAIMDEQGRLLPPGLEGEIVIRGENVTPGYLDNPAANQAAFTDGWFRTGDLGAFDQDGYLRITGRIKEMINRGGEKIAPREVDEALLAHPAVAQAIAFAIPDPRLGEDVAAAVVLRDGMQATAQDLRRFVSSRLADFKIPAQIVFVPEIPKGPTGKPQRIGLAQRLGIETPPLAAAPSGVPAFEPPATAAEKAIAAIWSEVLRVEKISVHDDFLSLGGDSILAAQIAARLRDRLQLDLRVTDLLEAPTIRLLAQRLQSADHPQPSKALVPLRQSGSRRPLFLPHGHEGNVFLYRALVSHLNPQQPVYGLQSLALSPRRPETESFETLAADFAREILSLQPRGPYFLAGFCTGAYLAFETACQLQEQGQDIALLAIINTPGDWRGVSSWADSVCYHAGILRSLSASEIAVYFAQRLHYRWNRIFDSSLRALHRLGVLPPPDRLPDRLRLSLLRDAHIRAGRRYSPQRKFRGRLIYIQGLGDAMRNHLPYWEPLVEGEILTLAVPGRGRAVLEEPNAATLAEILEKFLAEPA